MLLNDQYAGGAVGLAFAFRQLEQKNIECGSNRLSSPYFWLGPKVAKAQGQPEWLRPFTNGSLAFVFVFVNLLRRFVPPTPP